MTQHYTVALGRERVVRETEYAAWAGRADSPEHAQELAGHATLAWAPGGREVHEVPADIIPLHRGGGSRG
ncbi:hypothetical protein [Parafrankia sp. FMc2]|uniref:hypothetical protein n=1 Tax=Parafrankia sp. FMc2 TaxID=3233196 RepID=UPI0034D5809E